MPPLSEAAVSKSFRARQKNLERRSRPQVCTSLTRPKLERFVAAIVVLFQTLYMDRTDVSFEGN